MLEVESVPSFTRTVPGKPEDAVSAKFYYSVFFIFGWLGHNKLLKLSIPCAIFEKSKVVK